MSQLGLKEILDSVHTRAFFDDYYGKNVLHISGDPRRFAPLLSWAVLNEILRNNDLRFPRMRLVTNRKSAERHTYLAEVPGEASPLCLSVSKLNSQLRAGATLVINAMELLYEQLALLTEELNPIFKARVSANLYASWGTSSASGIHKDDHNVVVLQISGKKHWRVYRKTESFKIDPLDATIANEIATWDGVLSDGDVLHIPKDWPHVAIPCDEPTLHITLSMFEYNAINMLSWVCSRFADDEFMQQGIPCHSDTSKQQTFLSIVREKLTQSLADPNLFNAFFEDRVWLTTDKAQRFTGKAATRPFFGLPWSASRRGLPETDHGNYFIRLASPFGLNLGAARGNTVEVRFDNQVFDFDVLMLPILRKLEDGPFSVAEFVQLFSDTFSRPQLEDFLGELIKIGIIVVRDRQALSQR